MGTSFVARFDSTPSNLEQMLEAIDPFLYHHGIKYAGSLIELFPHRGWPTVRNLEFQRTTMSDVAKVASDWWGVGLECVSQFLVKNLGRGAVSEVDLSFFRHPKNRWTLHYTEHSAAADHRIESEEANRELIALQVDLCRAVGFKLSIYEEADSEGPPTVTLRNVETAIKRIAGYGGSESSMVVSADLMDLDRARHLAGPRAGEVLQSIHGFIVFPFLTGFPQ